jgi:hypothetical protein
VSQSVSDTVWWSTIIVLEVSYAVLGTSRDFLVYVGENNSRGGQFEGWGATGTKYIIYRARHCIVMRYML